MYRGGQLRDISEVSEVGVIIIQQFRHLGPFAHPLSSSPSVDHGLLDGQEMRSGKPRLKSFCDLGLKLESCRVTHRHRRDDVDRFLHL